MSDDLEVETQPAAASNNFLQERAPLIALIAIMLALVSTGIATWALLRPAGGVGSESYSDAQRAEAKSKACSAFATVRTGVSRNTNIPVPGGPEDVAGVLGVAANARIALYDGGQYLLERLDPATPDELQDTARRFANNLLDIGAAATAGSLDGDPEQAARLKNADELNVKLGDLCK